MAITVQDLRDGTIAKVKPADRARLINRSVSTLSRWRHEGKDLPFEVDTQTGRITYDAADVLKEIDGRRKFTCTAQYKHMGNERMELARKCKAKASS